MTEEILVETPKKKRCWRPKWMRDQDKENKEERRRRRELKRAEREAKAKKREERKAKRERHEKWLAEHPKNGKQEFFIPGRICFCDSCRKVKREMEMFNEDKCYACEYQVEAGATI